MLVAPSGGSAQLVAVATTIAVLAAISWAIVAALRLERSYLQPVAIIRAVLQLAVLTVILGQVIGNGWWAAAFLAVMVGAATWVTARRLDLTAADVLPVAGIIAVASALPVLVVFATGSVEFSPRYVLAVGGIVVGNAMTVCTLMGRSLAANFFSGRDEIEGWLALGARPRRASRRMVRSAASTALIPSTDQTRTTGIVTLPGAFVGAIFAGASPLQAAEFQLVVLASILVAGAVSVALLSVLFGAPAVLPPEGRIRYIKPSARPVRRVSRAAVDDQPRG